MAPERVIACGGASCRVSRGSPAPVVLDVYGRERNVYLQLEAVRRALWADIPPVLRDLLDVAVYVYAADQAVGRANGGRVDGAEVGAGWRRNFRFRVPVRQPDLWGSAPVREALVSVLSFLSEDEYAFEFSPLRKDTTLDGFINFDATPFDGEVAEVVMFSGGLDSLAGAVTEAVGGRRSVLLLNHRSNEKLTPRHGHLVRALEACAGTRRPLHFPVRVNKAKRLGREFTQRTRSFLFAALGAVFARMIGLDRLRFYENGIISLNLPPSAQVVGARASRTTHPRVLAGFGRLFSAVLDRPFAVENPFLWDTKTDVVKRIAAAGCGHLIGFSTSCAHTWEMKSRTHTHCGVCSQCIDRRFAVLAAGQEAHDPVTGYAVELLTGGRGDGEPRTMLTAYLELADRVERMGEAEFFGHFGEAARVLPHLSLTPRVGAARVFELYQRHARQVNGVLEDAIAEHRKAVRTRSLPPDCLLRLAYDDAAGGCSPGTDSEPVRPAGNYIVRRGACWAVRFGDGEEKIYTPERGLDYLQILLRCPGQTFTAAELASRFERLAAGRARGTTVAEAAAAGHGIVTSPAAQDALDSRDIEAMLLRLREIEDQRPIVAASDSPTRLDDLEEMDADERFIHAQLGRDCRLGGRPRRLADQRDRVRNRVSNAIRRALRRIARYDPPLAAHLAVPS